MNNIHTDDKKITTKSSLVVRKKRSWIEIFIALPSLIVQKVLKHVSIKTILIVFTLLVLATTSIILATSIRSVDPGPELLPSNETIYPIFSETLSPSSTETATPSKTVSKYPSKTEMMTPSNDETASPSSSGTFSSTAEDTMVPTGEEYHIGDMPSNKPSINQKQYISINPAFAPTNDGDCTGDDDNECSASATATSDPHETLAPTLSNVNQTSTPSDELSSYPSENPSIVLSYSPTKPQSEASSLPTSSPSIEPSSLQSDEPSGTPSTSPSNNPSNTPSSLPTDEPSSTPSSSPTGRPSAEPSSLPTYEPSSAPSSSPSDSPSTMPSTSPTSMPTYTPVPTFILEETILDDKLFGPSSSQCNNFIPENGEYSFTFDLSSLPYFDDTLSDIEEVMFLVQMSHTDTNSNRTWSIKLGKGGHIYSFIGPYGESIPLNKQSGTQFVEDVNQKKAVDSTKNAQAWFSVHQSGPLQNADPGYSDQTPYFFSPNVAVYCSTTVPECRLASWGQQSKNTAWTERIIFYDRYRDCGDGILERTHLIHNAEPESSNTVLIYANMPWTGIRYSTLKDFVFSQNPANWDYNEYNLQGGIEDPMLIYSLDESYGLTRLVQAAWTKGYTIFTEDLPFYEYPSTPQFKFPGRLPETADQPTLTLSYGPANTAWLCQGPLAGFNNPSENNYRCRFTDYGIRMSSGCYQCYLRFTNSIGDSVSVYHVRSWLLWNSVSEVNIMYFNSYESLSAIQSVMKNGETITVTWDELGKRPEDNLATSFVHGTSEQMVANQYSPSKLGFGHSNDLMRDNAMFVYMAYPDLAFGDTFRARQYYITDQFAGLNARSEAIVSDTIEEVILSGQLEMSTIKLYYIDNGNGQESTTFGLTVNDRPCITNSPTATTIACTGSSTPQIGKSAFVQIECGTSTYVGTDFYHFSNYPSTPYRASNCKVDGVTTANRPTVKLLGYFSEAECGVALQDKTFDVTFCS